MKHTYFFEEGVWSASGELLDGAGARLEVTGRSEVRHHADFWRNASLIRVAADPPVDIESEIRLSPIDEGCLSAKFTMRHSTLGTFSGTLAIVGGTILSTSRSQDSRHWSMECLVQLADNRYRNSGAFYSDGARASSWEMELVRG